ncbi:MAG: XrtA system polysaccharide chain length determinant [Dissulfurispiraceae bacterium]|jgi:polysaccharide biosynthesis transport protein
MSESSLNSFDLKRYWGLILQRRYLALSVALAVLSVCTLAGFIMPKVYEANTTIVVQRSTVINPLLQGVGVAGNIEDSLRILQNSIASKDAITRVIKKLGMVAEGPKPPSQDLINSIQKNIAVTVKGGGGRETADLFTISYKGDNPKNVKDIVNTLAEDYIDQTLGYRRSDAVGAFEFIQSQLAEYKAKLEDSDKSIREFREKNPSIIPQTEGAVLTRMETFQTAKIDADIKIRELMYKRESLRKQLTGEKQLTVAMVTTEGSPQARLNYLNTQLGILMTKFTDNYPEVLKTKSEIEDLRRQIAQAKTVPADAAGTETSTINPVYQQLKEELSRTDAEIESLKARSSELIRQQQLAKGVLGGMPKEQEEWTKLQRDRTVYQHIYDDLLNKLETARVSKDLETADKGTQFKIVDQATLPTYPIQPDRVKLIFAGIFFGIVSGCGVVLGLDYLNPSFKDEDSVEKSLHLPVLVAIPSVVVESDAIIIKQMDKKIFVAASAYLGLILLLLIIEMLHRYVGIIILPF